MRLLAAASILTLVIAAPALAQTPTQTPAAPPAATAPATPSDSAEEAAFNAKGEAFGKRMEAMAGEMQAAFTAAAGDQAKAKADLDAIQARYQPEADAFAMELESFGAAQAAQAPEEQRAAITSGIGSAIPIIKGVPAQVRSRSSRRRRKAQRPRRRPRRTSTDPGLTQAAAGPTPPPCPSCPSIRTCSPPFWGSWR